MPSKCALLSKHHEVNKESQARASDWKDNESILHFRPGKDSMNLRFYDVLVNKKREQKTRL